MKKLQTKNCKLEKQELTCNSTVIARPLLAHVSIFSSSKGKKKKIAEKRGQKNNLLTKRKKNGNFLKI